MIDEAIERLRDAGCPQPEKTVKELMDCGALTHYDLSKYVALQMWRERLVKYPSKPPTMLLKDVAAVCRVSLNTLRRCL